MDEIFVNDRHASPLTDHLDARSIGSCASIRNYCLLRDSLLKRFVEGCWTLLYANTWNRTHELDVLHLIRGGFKTGFPRMGV